MKAVSAHFAERKEKGGENWHEAYGIWFAGKFRVSVNEKHWPRTWICLDVKPSSLEPGEYEVDVWGHPGVLLFWKAQGYMRGVVISADECGLIESARKVMVSAPWSFEMVFRL